MDDDKEVERIMRVASRKGGITPRTGVASPRVSNAGDAHAPLSPHHEDPRLRQLHNQKKNVLGLISKGRSEIDRLSQEIARLTQERDSLLQQQSKRQESADALQAEIDAIEAGDKAEAERRAHEAEAARRRQQEEYERHREQELERLRQQAESRSMAPAPDVIRSGVIDDSNVALEEERLLRAMSHKGVNKIAAHFHHEDQPTSPGRIDQNQDAHERERHREEQRRQRLAELEVQRMLAEEENARREAEARARQEKEKEGINEFIASLKSKAGIDHTFVYDKCLEWDAECFLVGSMTDWRKVPVGREGDSLDFTITLPLERHKPHFYYFELNGSIEIDKTLPTGFGNGVLCNRITK